MAYAGNYLLKILKDTPALIPEEDYNSGNVNPVRDRASTPTIPDSSVLCNHGILSKICDSSKSED